MSVFRISAVYKKDKLALSFGFGPTPGGTVISRKVFL
jgi:hypothetical protein